MFIQVMREFLDDTPAKPSESDASFSYQDADTTADFYHVDYVSGEADPYYNGDDADDGGTQGNAISAPKVTAHMDDSPSYGDATFPTGKSKIKYESPEEMEHVVKSLHERVPQQDTLENGGPYLSLMLVLRDSRLGQHDYEAVFSRAQGVDVMQAITDALDADNGVGRKVMALRHQIAA